MKSERCSLPRSVRASHRHIPGNDRCTMIEYKPIDCKPIESALAESKVAKRRPSDALDVEKVLHFSQQLYAHALTLQEMIRNKSEISYEVLRPRYDRQAAQQFEIFYHSLEQSSEQGSDDSLERCSEEQPSALRQHAAASCE